MMSEFFEQVTNKDMRWKTLWRHGKNEVLQWESRSEGLQEGIQAKERRFGSHGNKAKRLL